MHIRAPALTTVSSSIPPHLAQGPRGALAVFARVTFKNHALAFLTQLCSELVESCSDQPLVRAMAIASTWTPHADPSLCCGTVQMLVTHAFFWASDMFPEPPISKMSMTLRLLPSSREHTIGGGSCGDMSFATTASFQSQIFLKISLCPFWPVCETRGSRMMPTRSSSSRRAQSQWDLKCTGQHTILMCFPSGS